MHPPLPPPRFVAVTAAVVVALAAPACDRVPSDRARDVVLVSMDTVRADGLGAWGNPAGTSPYLDRLARRGTAFGRCIAQASSTLPSHRSMFQGRAASRTSDEAPMLAEILQRAGWSTVAFTGGGNVAGELGFARGFDTYEESDRGLAWSVERLRDWLGAGGGEPFFAFLHGYDAHVPYDPPPPYHRLFDPDYHGPVRGSETRTLCRAIRGLEGAGPAPELDERDRRHLRALYDAGIRALDARVGELLRLLESEGLAERSLLVVMSDHGEEFWDHGSVLHSHTVYEELVHVPLMVRAPGGVPGRLDPATVRNLDLAPTVLDAVGRPPEPSHEGVSLLARVRGAPGDTLSAPSEMRAWKGLTRGSWKLVAQFEERTGAVYDLAVDPGETRNVAPFRPREARALAEELAGMVEGIRVREMAPTAPSPELEERLRALGYVE